MFSYEKSNKASSVYQISIKFRTLLSNALIFFMVNDNKTNNNFKLGKIINDYVLIELINGRLKYTYGFQKSIN